MRAALRRCTLCVFPAASAVVHLVWTVAFVAALRLAAARVSAAVLNAALRRRLRGLAAAACLLAGAGAGAVGASVAWGPFSWANQGCWLGYVATVAATVGLVVWEAVVSPVRALRAVSKVRRGQWRAGGSLVSPLPCCLPAFFLPPRVLPGGGAKGARRLSPGIA